ncbi:MAG: hypothetical protein DMG40_17490 [Acidobacteria bacterium]|nr:MAG: hypothetical protein DMG40_17490 [Acidobacteriota bacterium]
MGAGVLLLSALFTGHATLALAVSQQAQAPTPVPQEAAASPASDSSKQATDQGAARPEAGKKDAKPHHKIHVQLGLVSFGLGYTHFSGPYYYPYLYPYGAAYPAFFCDTFWCTYPSVLSAMYSGSLLYAEDKGEVKLTADPKTAEVYIDDAYAGKADQLRTMWLDSGAYDLSLSAKGRVAFHQRIYVLSRKSLRISAKLEPEKAPDAAPQEKEVKP